MRRPGKDEYAPYYENYISKIGDGDIIKILESQENQISEFINSIPEEKGTYSYAKGKWSIKEVIGHIIDTERVMAYRALCFARGEKQPLPGFEQEDYVKEANFNRQKFSALAAQFQLVRKANISLFKTFSEEMFDKKGKASGNNVTVLALLYIIAGHCAHHINIIKEKYMK
jgi:DinB superfamily